MSTPTKTQARRAAHHARKVADGKTLVQVYLPVELHDQMRGIARRKDVPISDVYEESSALFAARDERQIAAAWRVKLEAEDRALPR